MKKLHIEKNWFKDEDGRIIILRGVNLGGDCKVPYPNGGTNYPTDFSDHRDVSFIDRPFPVADADEHFQRLKSWGFNCLRLLTTWESIEHKGPGKFDKKYLDYYAKLCKIAGEYGFYVFVDFHQDVWSRMTGGDGAPCWTFEKIGIDYTKISKADAALVMQHAYDYNDPTPWQEDNYPMMCWIKNYNYPANGIMWTLFFGGNRFAPDLLVDGKNIQDYLQNHLVASQIEVAKRIKDLTNVIGFDPLNEPNNGWIGRPMDKKIGFQGIAWSPINCLYASHGYSLKLLYRKFLKKKTYKTVNKNEISIWLKGKTDPFHGKAWKLYKDGSYKILKNNFFQIVNGKKIDFYSNYLSSFWFKFVDSIREFNPDWILFLQKNPFDFLRSFPKNIPKNVVNASHWYDPNLIYRRKFVRILALYKLQLKLVKNISKKTTAGCPTLIGETGIPFDLNNAYKKYANGDYSSDPWRIHIRALDRLYNALDSLIINSTQWNYTASNRNNPLIADGWNQENFSIFSEDQRHDPNDINSGGRALEGFVRPYPKFIQGKPKKFKFNINTGNFEINFQLNPYIKKPTEIFVPRLQYPKGFDAITDDVEIVIDSKNQIVILKPKSDSPKSVRVMIKSKKG